jgi:hypothetical protein
MRKRLWPILLGPPMLLAAATIAVSRPPDNTAAGIAEPLRSVSACALADAIAGTGGGRPGSWWKAVERLDANGTLIGRSLFVGRGATTSATEELPVESSVSGPTDGLIVVVADDGRQSTIRLVSAAAGCGVVIAHTASVVRTAIVDRRNGSVLAHLVDRASRADLGTSRFSLGRDGVEHTELVAPALGQLAKHIGVVWGTDLRLDQGGGRLAVQSCTDLGCLSRIVDLAHPQATPIVLRDPQQGPMLGFAGSDLVTWAACPGKPCGIVSWNPSTGTKTTLVAGASAGALTADGRRLVALADTPNGPAAVAVEPLTGRSRSLRGLLTQERPFGLGAASSRGLEVADDEVAIGSDTTDLRPFRPDTATLETQP